MVNRTRGPTPELLEHLAARARAVRWHCLRMAHGANQGHPGTDLSAADVLTVLFAAVLRVDPREPQDPERDRFILSKGHAAGALYASMALAGFLPIEELDTYMQPMSRLCGHPTAGYLPGIEASTGPLGHGLAIAVGTALAGKIDGSERRTYVLVGDGELDEGSNWEALMAAAHYRLDRLVLVVDRNRVQQGDLTESTIGLEPLVDKIRAFGWATEAVDGHDHGALLSAFGDVPFVSGRPSCLIAQTFKGHGVSFLEDRVDSHHHIPTVDELAQAFAELSRQGVLDGLP
jgi:transketolase